MNAGNIRFKLTRSSLWHLWQGATQFVFAQGITILRLVLLLDVSKWQGVINFVQMFIAGGKGVFIKCAQGSTPDPKFVENWAKARQAKIPRGTYFFYDSRVDPKSQAAKWWDLIKGDKGELMHFLDLEENYGGNWKGWRNWKICLQEFMRLSALPASKIGIYTGYYYWIANSPTSLADLNWFAQFALWLAWYTLVAENVKIPKPWTTLLFWQFGTPVEGEKFGVESLEIDESYFNGDEQTYKRRFGLIELSEPPDEEPPVVVEPPVRPEIMPESKIWNAEILPIRTMTVRTYPIVADDTRTEDYLYSGEKFTGRLWSGNDYVWIRIATSARPQLLGRWVAVRSTDGLERFIKLTDPNPPPGTETGIYLPPGTFRQIEHDQEAKDGLQRIGMPEVYPLHLSQYCELTEAWQWFWFRQLIHSYTGYQHWDETRLSATELSALKAKWRSLTKKSEAFTNFKGTDIFKDYITPNNLAGLPGQEPLDCCGNIVKVLSVGVRLAGEMKTPIETLDGSKPPPPISKINRLTAPHLIFCATNVAADKSDPKNWKTFTLPDGRDRVDPFPHLGSRDTLVCLRTNDKEANDLKAKGTVLVAGTYTRDGVNYAVNYILSSRLKVFSGTRVPRAYVP